MRTSGLVFGGNWFVFDAFTGRQLTEVTGITTGASLAAPGLVPGPNGELLVYIYQGHNGASGFLTMWNSTLALGVMGTGETRVTRPGQFR